MTTRRPGQGRKPKPNAQKKATGSRHIKKNEPQFTSITSADAPEWLDDLAVGMWNTVCPRTVWAENSFSNRPAQSGNVL